MVKHPTISMVDNQIDCAKLGPEEKGQFNYALFGIEDRTELFEKIFTLLEYAYLTIVANYPQVHRIKVILLGVYVQRFDIDPDLPLIERISHAIGGLIMEAFNEAGVNDRPAQHELNEVARYLVEAYSAANDDCFAE